MKLQSKIGNAFLSSLIIAVPFTLIDAVFHYFLKPLEISEYSYKFLLPYLNSPLFWYAIGKFLGTILLGTIILSLIPKKLNLYSKTFIYTLLIVILLQIRYFYTGYYEINWHLLNLALHAKILFWSALIIFKWRKI